MQLRLTYQEISDMIKQRSGQSLPMSYGGPHTVHVSYGVNVLFHTTEVGLDLTVDSIEGSNIFISYSGGAGIEFMVRQALGVARNRPGGDMIEPLAGNRLMLSLGKNAQAGSLLDHVNLEDICFDEQYVIIEFTPKAV